MHIKPNSKIIVTLKKSVIGCTERQIAVVKALGLTRTGKSREHTATPSIVGMINKVSFLLEVSELATKKKPAVKKEVAQEGSNEVVGTA